MAVYNLDYRPLLKIGGWLSTKIRKSKTQKTSYHLHHPTISRFPQPPINTIPPQPKPLSQPFLTNHPSQITPKSNPKTPHILTPPLYTTYLKLTTPLHQKYHPYPLSFSPKPTLIHSNLL